MRKTIALVVAALACFSVAYLGNSILFPSFDADVWKFTPEYNLVRPSAVVEWFCHAGAVAFVLALAVLLRYHWQFSKLGVFVSAVVFGYGFIPLFSMIVFGIAYGYGISFSVDVAAGMLENSAILTHTVEAAIASTFGITLGKLMVTSPPARPMILTALATRSREIVRLLRKRLSRKRDDSQTMLKASVAGA